MKIEDVNLNPEELNKKSDHELLEIVDYEPTVFTKVPALRRDQYFCLQAIKRNPYILKYITEPTDEMVKIALKDYPRALLFVPKSKITVRRCVKACRKEPMLLNVVPSSIIDKVKTRLQYPILSYIIPHFILRRFVK